MEIYWCNLLNNNNYFIKKNYIPNNTNIAIENEKNYWTLGRIFQSFYTQYEIYKICKKIIKNTNIKSVLDIGCGSATKLMNLIYPITKEVYGIDQTRIINYCRKRFKLDTFLVDNIEDPSLKLEKKFDMIICADVIEHLLNPDKIIEYIKKYCHKDTIIVLSTPERDILRGKKCNKSIKPTHVREWNREEFNSYLKSRDLQILYQNVSQSFRILLNFKNSIKDIKNDFIILLYKASNYNKIGTLSGSQIAICTLEDTPIKNSLLNMNYQRNSSIFEIIKDLTMKLLDYTFKTYKTLFKK